MPPKLLSTWNLQFVRASSLCMLVVDDTKNLNGFVLTHKSHYNCDVHKFYHIVLSTWRHY